VAKKKAQRNYSQRTLKLLWGRAAGRCAFPECRMEVIVDQTDYDPIVVVGDIAHIAGASDDGPRARKELTSDERDNYKNLILLCKNCHGKIDGQSVFHSEAMLLELKAKHEDWVRKSLPERGMSTTGWTVMVLEGDHPTDIGTAAAALAPDFPDGPPAKIAVPSNTTDWRAVGDEIAVKSRDILSNTDSFERRLAVFPLAPVSACVALGYHLTSRPHVRLYQNHRDTKNWAWHRIAAPANDLQIELASALGEPEDVAFVFHLSATIQDDALSAVIGPTAPRFHLRLPSATVNWLIHPDQIVYAAAAARHMFEKAMQKYPGAKRWHLFFAGPAPVGVAIGQQINPTMFPSVQLYEFRFKETPQYRESIELA
jgi:hypothetical protein